jgi:membrane-associated phospholipid phosphatase
VPLLCGALLLGFARVFVGAHYPGDIGGAFLIALAITSEVWVLRDLLEIPIEAILRLCARLHLASGEDIPYPPGLAGGSMSSRAPR